MKNKSLGLYIHIPFCRSKCPYCSFYSVCTSDDNKLKLYKDQVIKEVKKWSNRVRTKIDSIYFGGGTPSLIGSDRLYEIIFAIRKYFNVSSDCEITIEVNPNSLKKFDFLKLKEIGLNRVSIGVQSVNNDELKLLGRSHSKDDIDTALGLIYKSGIYNISADLMLGIQNQSIRSLQKSIDYLISRDVKHVSAYMLQLEENTLYYKKKDQLKLPSEDEEAEMYLFLVDYLHAHGVNQYEISNFSFDGYESKHNSKYWNIDDYLGLGASAHSYFGMKRFFTDKNLSSFLNNVKYIDERSLKEINMDNYVFNDEEFLSTDYIEEYIMLRLRLTKGLIFDEFYNRFGVNIPEKYIQNAKRFKNTELLILSDKGLKLTKKGFLISNTLISEILYGNS